jgi:chemotaxis protein MotB
MRWLLTYADMITLLLAFFVVLYAISKVDAKKYQTFSTAVRGAFGAPGAPPIGARVAGGEGLLPRPDPAAGVLQRLRQTLGRELNSGKVQVERHRDGVLLRFQDAVFFERGKADLHGEARRILDKVVMVIRELSHAIEAEGHTDTLPIRSTQFPSNWELSVARATAVVRYLVEAHGVSPLRLAARGMGEYQPLYPNDARWGEPRNRRVELKIRMPG